MAQTPPYPPDPVLVSSYGEVTSVVCRSPGFGLTLVAETVNGTFLGAEVVSTPQGQGDPVLPEDLGRDCAKLLLEEIYRVSRTKHTRRICWDSL